MRRRVTTRARRLAAIALLALVPLVMAASPQAVGDVLPTASCYDGRSFDGLETRYTADYCRDAVNAAGYAGTAFHNASAQSQLTREPTDAVYFFAGHSLVAADPYTGVPFAAVGLLHESPGPNQNFDALVGDPSAAPLLQGPIGICNETGSDCRSVMMTAYPWASQLTQHNLVVLESCNTAGSNSSYLGMAETAQLAGAGTVIGFKDVVYFPVNCPNCDSTGIRWARVFWDNLRAGYTYTTATINATNSLAGGYGYGSYRILTNPGAPQTLRPAQYYVWPAGGIGAAQTAEGTSSENLSTSNTATWESILTNWLGTTPSTGGSWTTSGENSTVETYRPGLGLFKIDPKTEQINEAVFEEEITSGPVQVDADKALDIAHGFAVSHHHDIGDMPLRSIDFLDHGAFSEYRVTWQARHGAAWLPTRTTVGINATTGRVVYFDHDPTRLMVNPDAGVTEDQAVRSASALLEGPNWTARTRPSLEVVTDSDGTQHLAWVHEIARKYTGTAVPDAVVIWTDAHTGQSRIQART